MEEDMRWWQIPRRLLELSRGAAAAAAAAGTAAAAAKSEDPACSPETLTARPSSLKCLLPCEPTVSPEVLGPVYPDSIVRSNERGGEEEEDSDSSDGSTLTESETDTDEETLSDTTLQQVSPLGTEAMISKEGPVVVVGGGGASGVVRPQSSFVAMNGRRPTSAPTPYVLPVLTSSSGCSSPAHATMSSSPPCDASGSAFPKACATAAQALAQRVQSVMGGGSIGIPGVGVGNHSSSKSMTGSGSAGTSRAAHALEASNMARWSSSIASPSNTTLCQAGYAGALSRRSELLPASTRRVPPPSLMASPWWRNMEEQSPAFAAVSQRFHAIAHAQARERLAGNLARLAVLHEAEEATREQRDALRMALGMPALARWAQTKAQEPLPAFLLRTLAALLDLSVELVKHAVLMGWVLLGVFNRLLYEVLTANRSAFGRPYKLWS